MNTNELNSIFEKHAFLSNFGYEPEVGMGGAYYQRDLSDTSWITLGGNTGTDDFENILGCDASRVNATIVSESGHEEHFFQLSDVLDIEKTTIVTQELIEQFLTKVNDAI